MSVYMYSIILGPNNYFYIHVSSSSEYIGIRSYR